MTQGQELAVEQLQEIAVASDGLLEVISVADCPRFTKVEIAIYCGSMNRKPDGLPLRDRERIVVAIPSDFPFEPAPLYTHHTRFAGFPHVQWKRFPCLYQSPATEWNPSDGMFGFIDRLDFWLRQAALGQLDPLGAPIHPPVIYAPSGPIRTIFPRADTPHVGDQPWYGEAHIRVVSERRADIIGWSGMGESAPSPVGAAILLSKQMPYEFPSKLSDLVAELEARDVPRQNLLLILQSTVLKNGNRDPLFLIIGTPMRGISGSERLQQHIAAWYINPTIVNGLRISLEKYSDHKRLQEIGAKAEKIVLEWMQKAPVEWCRVREDRPEIVVRRDSGTAVNWFSGKQVSLWGCGALGSPIAEFLARAGVKKLILRDNGVVAPGLLVRQPFHDRDIGLAKAAVVAGQIKQIRSDIEVDHCTSNIIDDPLASENWTDGSDIVIDTTASVAVMRKLELVRRTADVPSVPIASMIVGHEANNGLLALAHEKYSGGAADVFRRAKIEICNRPHLKHFADEFWPILPRTRPFQPEPGCSESTFVGSATDVAVLAGTMLNRLAWLLARHSPTTAHAYCLTQPHSCLNSGQNGFASFDWDPDQLCQDPHSGYEVRIASSGWSEINGWINQNRRTEGSDVETGGILFGERDDASRVIWVTDATGSPPDSEKSRQGFVCGIKGIAETDSDKRERTRNAVQYLGMWHTHPGSAPLPSLIDLRSMGRVLRSNSASKSLMLIVGTFEDFDTSVIGTFLFKRSDLDEKHRSVRVRDCSIHIAAHSLRPRQIGLSLSGGGSRAIAFHLGCLRALHDRNILDQIRVISTVSGGSIIGALYAYSDDSFEEFEERVLTLLRRGLLPTMIGSLFFSTVLLRSIGSVIVSGLAAIGADVLRYALKTGSLLIGSGDRGELTWVDKIQPPLRRWSSRTTAFEDALRRELFSGKKLTDKRRDDIDIIINACELRTGSAFRFGSKESGCWRFGRIVNNDVQIARAVAASAAYPAVLPAVDLRFTFIDRAGKKSPERVILTDGGAYDNLGITCLEPGRSSEHTLRANIE